MAEVTKIRLGRSDGMRFVGIKPPLSEEEVATLEESGLIRSKGSFEQIAGAQACSLVRRGGSNNEAVVELAGQIAESLGDTRESIDIDLSSMVELQGYGSSPFEPVTNR